MKKQKATCNWTDDGCLFFHRKNGKGCVQAILTADESGAYRYVARVDHIYGDPLDDDNQDHEHLSNNDFDTIFNAVGAHFGITEMPDIHDFFVRKAFKAIYPVVVRWNKRAGKYRVNARTFTNNVLTDGAVNVHYGQTLCGLLRIDWELVGDEWAERIDENKKNNEKAS